MAEQRIVVVGNGLFGAAATRHLAERRAAVTCIGAPPTVPDIRDRIDANPPAHRVYSSHNDAARLTRRHDRNPLWVELTERAVAGYRDLESMSGVSFFHDVGRLVASRPGSSDSSTDPLAPLRDDHDAVVFEPGDDSWHERWPWLSFPAGHAVGFEPSPAGYLRPKSLIEAQNVLAERAGARLIADTVTSVQRDGAAFRLETAEGREVAADRVLVAAGAFTNFNGLLEVPVDITLKSEVIVLGEVSDADARDLARAPTVNYRIDSPDLDDIYMVPPVRYEDGRSYIKMGANTRLDQWFTSLDEVQQWFNTDTDAAYLSMYEPALRALWPAVDFVSVQTRPCIITYTPNGMPLIEHLGDGLFVATAGNGGGAKGSDSWGAMAAALLWGRT